MAATAKPGPFSLREVTGSPPAGFSFARTGRGSEGEWTVTADPTHLRRDNLDGGLAPLTYEKSG